jgi:hypothetical protein
MITDRNFNQVCVLEEMNAINEWLKQLDYLVVIGHDLQVEGIVTLKDIQQHPYGCLNDCNLKKPKVDMTDSIFVAWTMMKSSGSDFLPVYEDGNFTGVISLKKITATLVGALSEYLNIHRQLLQHLRVPLVNLQGLVNILRDAELGDENKQALSYCEESCYQAIKVLQESEKLNLVEQV